MLKVLYRLPWLLFLAACSGPAPQAPAPAAKAETADEFVVRTNQTLEAAFREAQAADFTQQTFINSDTELMNAKAEERYLIALGDAVKESRRFEGQKLSPAAARALLKLKLNVPAPAPDDPAKRAEMTRLESRLSAQYGEGKYCPKGPASCKTLEQLSDTMATSRHYDELLEAWKGWHDVGAGMRTDYSRFVELSNEGARTLGFKDTGVLWRSDYDMSPEEFDGDLERLWDQVKPLYDSLQCYARAKLAKKYGEDKVPPGKPIPAHLLGNMWGQTWGNIYEDILKPYPQASIKSAAEEMKRQKWDGARMTRSAESFYTSLGFPALPQSFWEHSMLQRPRDREVVCHASAWDMGPPDVRVKVCLQPNADDLYTIYHELGHVYYFLSYANQPYLFRNGANDGFHEAIGDTINLSVTPAYLARIQLIPAVKPSREAVLNQQMKMALDRVAFLPFGRLIDLWRWKVFSGEIPPAQYNAAWWELRRRYQGVAPPVARSESDFDPGAKYHIPANSPYARYFIAYIAQFQFHKALCQAAGDKGPLHECSVFNSPRAGKKFAQMLSQGASQPWQDTLEQLTGERKLDAGALIEYFQPLRAWLDEQNKSQQCGW